MAWGFLKDKISKIKKDSFIGSFKKNASSPQEGSEDKTAQGGDLPEAKSELKVKNAEKKIWEKTDNELEAELNKISPEILAQAKNPQMRKLIVSVYRQMLKDGVNVNNDREVKKWLKKHPEALQGGEVQKVETFKRDEQKLGRNEPCVCGSGKKYKKCCGNNK